jgi:uncharacterized protein
MKNSILILILVLGGLGSAGAQTSSGSSAQFAHGQADSGADLGSAAARIDPGKKADIERLLELTGIKTIVASTMDSTMKGLRPLLVSSLPPGEYREKLIDLFVDKFHSQADPQQVVELVMPIYDKYFSDEEIRGLIKFYETPLGQKAVSLLPQVSNEAREAGKTWGGKLGRESMQEVLAEHPDLAEALTAASKSQPK